MTRLDPPGAVRWITRTLEDAGFETWAVGGAVRDALLGRPSTDWDLTTRATPDEMRRLFRRTVPIGIDHGTMGILDRGGTLYEVTTFRRDVETTGRHAVVAFADTLQADLARRDFTVNAVAWHPLRARFFDPFEGARDLERGLLRTVGDPSRRFAEDYLRILRALRFAGRFSLAVEGETWRALTRSVSEMGRLSPERIREELEKILGGEEPPSRSLSLYAASGALAFLYPELEALVGRRSHPFGPDEEIPGVGGDRWSTSLRAVDLLSPQRPELRFAALLHGIGSYAHGAISEDAAPRGAPPQERATLRAVAILTRLRASNARIRRVGTLVGAAARPPVPGSPPAELRRWLSRAGREEAPRAIALVAVLYRASLLSGPFRAAPGRVLREDEATSPASAGMEAPSVADAVELVRALRRELSSGAPLSVQELCIDGRDLIRMGFRPGPGFGIVLEALLERVLEDPGMHDPVTLSEEALARMAAAEGEGGDRRGTGPGNDRRDRRGTGPGSDREGGRGPTGSRPG